MQTNNTFVLNLFIFYDLLKNDNFFNYKTLFLYIRDSVREKDSKMIKNTLATPH